MRTLSGLLLAVAMVPSHLGSGDSVQPRDTEAVIESVNPALPVGVRVDIVGSDTFVRVRSNGHEVNVPGYEGEPYIRIARDGAVDVNDGSTTAVLNGNRYGNVDMSSFTPTREPIWRRVSNGGVAMWHDHRSHWMSPKPPAAIDGTGKVLDFSIPLEVDGVATTVRGSLYLRESASPAWWLVGLVGLIGALMVALLWRRAMWMLLSGFAATGFGVGILEWVGLPDGARITPVLAAFCLAAAVVAVSAFASGRRGLDQVVPVLTGGSAATLMTAVWLCADHVRSPYVPGLGDSPMTRVVIPLMLGVAVVALVDSVTTVVRRDGR